MVKVLIALGLVAVAFYVCLGVCSEFGRSLFEPLSETPSSAVNRPAESTSEAASDRATDSRSEASANPKLVRVQTLEVEILKLYMESRSHAAIDVRFINTSNVYLQHWAISVEVYGPDDTYLGEGEAMASYMQPGQSKVEQVLLLDTDAAKVRRYRISLDGVVGKPGLRIDDQFELKVR